MNYKIVSDWAKAAAAEAKVEAAVHNTKGTLDFFWPAHLKYSGVIPGCFLFNIRDIKMLNRSTCWIARDGLVPLTWFFLQNPTPPKSLATKIYIHHSVQEIVPKPWQKLIRVYKLQPDEKLIRQKKSKLLITGLMCKSYVDVANLKNQINSLNQLFDSQKIKIENCSIFTVARHNGHGSEHDHTFHFEFTNEIIKGFGTEFKIYKWNQFEMANDFSDYYVVDLNSRYIIADSFNIHHAIARGATYLEPGGDLQPIETVPLSRSHHWALAKVGQNTTALALAKAGLKQAQEFSDYFVEDGLADVQKRFPWPDWVTDWAKFDGK
jgi:hypothetical protein